MAVAILGGGAWGKALYHALSQKNEVNIVSRSILGAGFKQCSLEEASQKEYLILAISTAFLRDFLAQTNIPKTSKLLVAAKGIEEDSGALVSEILEKFFPKNSLAYLAGPSFAAEVNQSLPCAVVIHSYNLPLAKEFSTLFPSFMRTYCSDDVIGGEIAGAYKNVIAIASGICEGLCLGQNAKAALLARGLVEMSRFGEFFGAKMETFLGLSGAGDLFLTSSSILSRNYRVGLFLAQKMPLEEIIVKIGEVAEGIKTSQAINILAKKHQIYTPIASEISNIIQGKDAQKSLNDMLLHNR
ncbi:glycerol-3-phosphate dehydrogenase [Helicobacter monodelphidis]|uniref:NAD(P)H-dependent glycerol-3-phosphate dehydrogenase n=1 Tax=Helicobacter sp. 15-1451 TaxID=2004995 RepID=UPI000DCAFA7F|nr:NAD(P)H-dependent glycerol-3-phosphate dehydrogenase [Helicobacter sp. 15-1451]RAX57900.1 glycerol-3-phosphate dehydrogenase [Helicobacter sp. 15-1451]